MEKSYFFYDLETSGISPRSDRIMQFAGQRTDMELNRIGQSVNWLIKLADDTLPAPEAVLLTGITPQRTVEEGYSEAEASRKLYDEVFTPGTIAVGFNNIRFDDEFLRHLFWRNFHDPYEWTWRDDRSRWDMLDVVRMTRALRPAGINWPVDESGSPTNRLELLTKANGIDHYRAHDAMSDVEALISLTGLLRTNQSRLFDYLFNMKSKAAVSELVNPQNPRPFVYTSGRYEKTYGMTTVAWPLSPGRNGNVIVYDLRYDPSEWLDLPASELEKRLFQRSSADKTNEQRPPLKELALNRSPAVAPISVLTQENAWGNIALNEADVKSNLSKLLSAPHFAENAREVFQNRSLPKSDSAEEQLYEGFLNDADRRLVEQVRNASEAQLADWHPGFTDDRLNELLLRYKARNYPNSLSQDESVAWEKWRSTRLNRQLPGFMRSLGELVIKNTDETSRFLLEELQLWAESILPAD